MRRIEAWAGVVVALITYKLLQFPSTKDEQMNVSRLVGDMSSVYQLIMHKPSSPSLIRERLLFTSNQGAVWPAGLFNLVELACSNEHSSWD
jgi:hypothetical protein